MTSETIEDKDLLAAVDKQDKSLVSRLLARGADQNMASENGWTPLMLAILHDATAMVKLLLENSADPNLTTQSQENPCRSPLAVAVSNGRLEAVELLIAFGANPNIPDYNGLTAIDLAQKLAPRPLHQDHMTRILFFLQEESKTSLPQPYSLAK